MGHLLNSLHSAGNTGVQPNLGGYDFDKMTVFGDVARFMTYFYNACSMDNLSRPLDKFFSINEKWMWHGCDRASVQSIFRNGFMEQFNHTSMYGKGSYFARDATYSLNDNFSKVTTETIKGVRYYRKCILYCRVLAGNTTPGGNGSTILPKWKGDVLFNSFCDQPRDPSIVVVKDGYAYPAYALEFIKRA